MLYQVTCASFINLIIFTILKVDVVSGAKDVFTVIYRMCYR